MQYSNIEISVSTNQQLLLFMVPDQKLKQSFHHYRKTRYLKTL